MIAALLAPLIARIGAMATYALIAAAAALLAGGGAWIWLARHDAALRAGWVAAAELKAATDMADAYRAGAEAEREKYQRDAAAVVASAPVHQEINRREAAAPVAVPAPYAAALDELRRRRAGGGP